MKKLFITSLTALSIMTVTTNQSAAAVNPLITGTDVLYGTMPFSKLSVADMEDAVKEGIKLHEQEIAAIVNQRSVPTFQNTIVALDRSGKVLSRAELTMSNLESANSSPELMEAYARVTPLLSNHITNMMLNEGLWNRVKQVYSLMDKDSTLTEEDRRLIQKTYDSFIESGANLSGADRDRFRELQAELSDLNVKFSQNITNAMADPNRRLWLKEADLEGIPESIKSAYRAAAAETLAEEGKQDDGSLYLVTIYRPSYAPFMKFSTNRELRKKLFELSGTKNTSGEYDNTQILKDIANIRFEIAGLMGKKNYAEYILHNTMAKTPEAVMDFLQDLNKDYTGPMRAEIEDLQNEARKTEGEDFVLMPWDYSFWYEKVKNDRYAFNEEEMKDYFELNNTIDGVFGLATKLYGYKFKENKQIDKYHPDVKVYEVYDKNGKILGILYADFYYRPSKRPGAWMTEFRSEYLEEDGTRILPLISIVCNFPKPVGNNPVLLSPDDVETFLHEFGHALHGLSSQATYESLAGTNVKHDFVELFSQFNENYFTQKEFLDGFAKHHKTGKKMPKELIEKLISTAQFGAAYATMRQLGFGFLDMAYHTIEKPLRASEDIKAFEEKAIDPVRIFPAVDFSWISPSFSHIFSGGYAAGYYGYKWSEALDADAFAAFKENGIFNKNTAEKFHKMLESGDTRDPMELYVEFRGKKPNNDALLERDGIKISK